MSKKYITVSLPEPLIEKVDKIIDIKKLGYTSRPEFIKDSIRRHLERLGGEDFDLFEEDTAEN